MEEKLLQFSDWWKTLWDQEKLTFSDNLILLHQPDIDLKFVFFVHRDITWEDSGPGPVLFSTFVMTAVCLGKTWRAHDNMLICDNLW